MPLYQLDGTNKSSSKQLTFKNYVEYKTKLQKLITHKLYSNFFFYFKKYFLRSKRYQLKCCCSFVLFRGGF